MWHGILPGDLILVSYFLCLSSSMKLGTGANFIELLKHNKVAKQPQLCLPQHGNLPNCQLQIVSSVFNPNKNPVNNNHIQASCSLFPTQTGMAHVYARSFFPYNISSKFRLQHPPPTRPPCSKGEVVFIMDFSSQVKIPQVRYVGKKIISENQHPRRLRVWVTNPKCNHRYWKR